MENTGTFDASTVHLDCGEDAAWKDKAKELAQGIEVLLAVVKPYREAAMMAMKNCGDDSGMMKFRFMIERFAINKVAKQAANVLGKEFKEWKDDVKDWPEEGEEWKESK